MFFVWIEKHKRVIGRVLYLDEWSIMYFFWEDKQMLEIFNTNGT